MVGGWSRRQRVLGILCGCVCVCVCVCGVCDIVLVGICVCGCLGVRAMVVESVCVQFILL